MPIPRGSLGLASILAVLLGPSCVAPQRALTSDHRRLSVEVTELRVQNRRDRRRIRDLEHELLLARKDDAAGAVPPVEVVVQEAPTLPAPPATPPEGEPITALAEDPGIEVIYEGEAARSTARRPQVMLHERTADGDDAGALRAPASRAALPPLPEVPVGEALVVTRGEVPTVAAQLRQARVAPPQVRAAPSDPRADYQRYRTALGAGDHAAAAAGFAGFVARHPAHALADNAQYWLGETYYDQKDYARALVEFQRVLDRYPRGNKVADARLKIGYCHAAVGRLDAARQVLREVIELHPKTAAAQLARERLTALQRKP